jgi:hypothetical protein
MPSTAPVGLTIDQRAEAARTATAESRDAADLTAALADFPRSVLAALADLTYVDHHPGARKETIIRLLVADWIADDDADEQTAPHRSTHVDPS